MSKNSGMVVITKNGEHGRTFNNKELINGKVQVFKATKFKEVAGLKVATEYQRTAVLCDPKGLKIIGYID